MSSFIISDEKLAKFVSSFDDTYYNTHGNPYLENLFKDIIPTPMPKSDETIAKEAGD